MSAQTSLGERVLAVLARLEAHYDLDLWHWREDTAPLDVCLGAVLVQHTTWRSVEAALEKLRANGVFDLESIRSMGGNRLAELVRPAGLPLTKAYRLQAFARLCAESGGLDALLSLDPTDLRAHLLSTSGIGPETADVILLFAAGVTTFVHDAYAARLFGRLGLGPRQDTYAAWKSWFEALLPLDLGVYRRLRAGIVTHCKETCRKRPRCYACPLLADCPFGQDTVAHRLIKSSDRDA